MCMSISAIIFLSSCLTEYVLKVLSSISLIIDSRHPWLDEILRPVHLDLRAEIILQYTLSDTNYDSNDLYS